MIKSPCPGIIISAFKGGSGKTILSLGLVGAFYQKGVSILPFKKGPDYIDASWLAMAAGHPCYNLDPFLMEKDVIVASYMYRSRKGDMAVAEGNRGLYDGVDEAGTCSTAELAKLLKLPVILVIDCTKMTRTAAALVLGCKDLDPDVDIAGCVLNQVARTRHEDIVRNTIEHYTDVPVLGALPRMKKDPLPMRHLGVVPCEEHPAARVVLDNVIELVRDHVDIDGITRVAGRAGMLEWPWPERRTLYDSPESRPVRIGVFKDEAFQFYYPENLEALESAGAKLVFLNSLTSESLSGVDALYIGGGFPETQAAHIAERTSFLSSVKAFAEQGGPIYAECGGLMFLGGAIEYKGVRYNMAGVLPWDFVVGRRPQGHGYTVLEACEDNPYYKSGELIRGHEFHYSRPVGLTPEDSKSYFSCKVLRGHGFDGLHEGLVYKNVFGTYTHTHALENTVWADRLISVAENYKSHFTK